MKTQNGFHVNLNQCTGCQACMLACSIENDLPFGESWRNVVTFNEPQHEDLPVYHLSMACNHCDDPACLRGCPALAYSKDPDTGAVTIDDQKCIGCKYCTWMCPYDAPKFDVKQGIMKKCTFCNDRLHAGLEPACVSYCPTGALGFGETEIVGKTFDLPGFTETSIGPSIEFVKLVQLQGQSDSEVATRSANGESELLDTIERKQQTNQATAFRQRGPSKITLRSEWTLYLFTIIAPLLVAWFTSAMFASTPIDAYVYAAIGAIGMGISTLHLGKKLRAYRAMFNLRRSWLSREIFFFSGFFGMSTAVLLAQRFGFLEANSPWFGTISLVGALALLSMDMVYVAAATTRSVRSHSASVLLSGLFFTGVLSGQGWLAIVIGITKAALYVVRKWQFSNEQKMHPIELAGSRFGFNGVNLWKLSSIRVGIGLLLPLIVWLAGGPVSAIFLLCVAGELIDRAEFYDEVEIVTPKHQTNRDLAKAVSNR